MTRSQCVYDKLLKLRLLKRNPVIVSINLLSSLFSLFKVNNITNKCLYSSQLSQIFQISYIVPVHACACLRARGVYACGVECARAWCVRV